MRIIAVPTTPSFLSSLLLSAAPASPTSIRHAGPRPSGNLGGAGFDPVVEALSSTSVTEDVSFLDAYPEKARQVGRTLILLDEVENRDARTRRR
jgi:hypothetical protein